MHSGKTYRLIALTLAFVIAISSLGLTVNVHYCQGNLSGISLLPKRDMAGCHAASSTISKQSCCTITSDGEEPCCSDRTSIVSLDYDGLGVSLGTLVDFNWAKILPQPRVMDIIPPTLIISASSLDPPDDVFPSGQFVRIAMSSFLC